MLQNMSRSAMRQKVLAHCERLVFAARQVANDRHNSDLFKNELEKEKQAAYKYLEELRNLPGREHTLMQDAMENLYFHWKNPMKYI